MAKVFLIVLLLSVFKINCSAVSLHGIQSASSVSSSEVAASNKNGVRVTRQTLGYQNRGSPDIVVLSPGTNQAYRGIPTSNSGRGQTVVVQMPNDNYGYNQRYIVKLHRETRLNH